MMHRSHKTDTALSPALDNLSHVDVVNLQSAKLENGATGEGEIPFNGWILSDRCRDREQRFSAPAQDDNDHDRHPHDIHTATPIKHLVVIFNENRLIRSLLRDLSERGQSDRFDSLRAEAAYAEGEQPRQR